MACEQPYDCRAVIFNFNVDRSLITHPRKRWHIALAAISAIRRMTSLVLSAKTHKHFLHALSSRSVSYTILDIQPNPHTSVDILTNNVFNLDKIALVEIVKNKDFTSLNHLGGVQAVSTALHSDPEQSRIIIPIETTDVNKTALAKMVKERNLEQLKQYGGIQGVAKVLDADLVQGIPGTPGDVDSRLNVFGSNRCQPPKNQKGFFHFVRQAFKGTTILVLLSSAILSLFFGIKTHGWKEGWCDGGSLLFAVFLVVAASSASKFRLSRHVQKSSSINSNIQIEVVRGGQPQNISIFDIVVGDIIRLNFGDQIPGDGLLLDGQLLRVDEWSMTGESKFVDVDANSNPFLLSGAKVVAGHGNMLVTSVGINTEWGQMMSSIGHDPDQRTPLQAQLDELASFLCKVLLLFPFLALVGMGVHDFIKNHHELDGCDTKMNNLVNALSGVRGFVSVNAAVAIVVVAIPEGLPLVTTNALACSMKKIMALPIMVQRLSATETMGSATICVLTLNSVVSEFWLGEEPMKDETLSGQGMAPDIFELLQQGVCSCSTSDNHSHSSGNLPDGSPTKKALLAWAVSKLGMDQKEVNQSYKVLRVPALDSKLMKKCRIKPIKNNDQMIYVHWMGDAEMIMTMCTSYYESNGTIKTMDEGRRNKLEKIIKGMKEKSLTCIALAHKQISSSDLEHSDEGMERPEIEENSLTLLGLLGLKDPVQMVKACERAGVKIKMLTRDDVLQARSIAIDFGILGPDEDLKIEETVVEGEDFRKYSNREMMEKADKIKVMARCCSFDKYMIVQCLKRKNQVVVVIGDDRNDMRAIKEADIGIYMRTQYTQMEMETSDIIIAEGNFDSLITVLKWGRCIYSNIQKFIQFQLTVNVATLVINFIAAVSSSRVPLTAIQLLWVNLIMDVFGALALAAEQPTEELMEKPPVGRSKSDLINGFMYRNLIGQALYQVAVLMVLHFSGSSIFEVSEEINDTLMFNTFVLCQIFNLFNARKLEKKNVLGGIHEENQFFLGIVMITVVLQVVMVEFLNSFANTKRLNLEQWVLCIGLAALSWPIDWAVKCIPVAKLFYNTRDDASHEKEA